ncbi:hypothetical protein HGQ98_20295 [Achromobacter ruhlandii]|uniref:Uncharacterized protein n=1 Tax=Achromobacter ruhlandii TaxID=72557 RepID=A0A848NR04_9BURK|nr:hypothetical protein [Achromobacter ruhlandii]NMU92015.1 hypothetical protein [Achromobacter ruhlandii]
MSHCGIDALDAARMGDVRDPYRAERLRVQMQAARGAPAPSFTRPQAERPRATTPPGVTGLARAGAGASVDPLRDQYTAHCVRNAIRAFHEEQARLQARAGAAKDLGTIPALLPLQPYRIAAAQPALLPPALVVAASAAQAMVAPVAAATAPCNATDDALATDPATRARTRRG